MRPTILSPSEFLLRELEDRKARNAQFSMRAFAKKAGIASGRFSELLAGKRRLTRDLAVKIAHKLDLSARKKKVLLDLVEVAKSDPVQRVRLKNGHGAVDFSGFLGDWELSETDGDLRFGLEIRPHPSNNREVEILYVEAGREKRKNLSSLPEAFESVEGTHPRMHVICEPLVFEDRLLISSVYRTVDSASLPLLCSALTEIAVLTNGKLLYRRNVLTNYLDEGVFISGAQGFEALYSRPAGGGRG